MSAPHAALYENHTTHTRLAPFKRRFSVHVPQLLLDIDRVAETAAHLKRLRYNERGMFSFFDSDHGDRSGAPLRAWAEAMFAEAGVMLGGGRIELLCFPRVLGRVFNPLSLFFGYGPDGDLRGVIYEVNNTFGETHCYVAAIAGEERPARHRAEKKLYVSPFFEAHGEYNFALAAPKEHFSLVVENFEDGRRVHVATLAGRRAALTDAALMKAFVALPFMGLRTLVSIHWQAFWLWLRGAKLRAKPSPPLAAVTLATHTLQQKTLDRAA